MNRVSLRRTSTKRCTIIGLIAACAVIWPVAPWAGQSTAVAGESMTVASESIEPMLVAPASVHEGCTTNTSGYEGDRFWLAGVMAGCVRSNLTIVAKLFYEGVYTGVRNGPVYCTSSTSCSLAGETYFECLEPGLWWIEVKGSHKGGTDKPTYYWYVAPTAAQACAAAHPSYPMLR